MSDIGAALRTFALRYPEAQEGVACEGTPLEKRTIMARNKAFLFLGVADAMLKLRESVPEATAMGSSEPDLFKIGAHGWVTVKLNDDGSMPLDLLQAWIDESYRSVAAKQLVVELTEHGLATGIAAPSPSGPSGRGLG